MQGTQVSMDVLSLTANISFRDQDGQHERLSKDPCAAKARFPWIQWARLHPSHALLPGEREVTRCNKAQFYRYFPRKMLSEQRAALAPIICWD